MSECKVLCIGDPHFKESNVDEMKLFTAEVLKVINVETPDLIVVLGDVHDTHEKLHMYAAVYSNEFLYEVWKKVPNIVIIVGNHDRIDNQDFLTKFSFFNSYKNWKGVTVVDKVREIGMLGHRFVFAPYVYPGRLFEALTDYKVPFEGIAAFFSHQEFFGAHYGGRESEIGDKWSSEYPPMISGHIHDDHIVGTNVFYTGTPVQHTFGNEKKKSISLFTFGTGFARKKIKLGLPAKKKVTLSPEDTLTWVPPVNTYIKLEIKGTREQLQSLDKSGILEKFRQMGIEIKKTPLRMRKQIINMLKPNQKRSFLGLLSDLMKSKPEQLIYCRVFNFDSNIFTNKTDSTKKRVIRIRR